MSPVGLPLVWRPSCLLNLSPCVSSLPTTQSLPPLPLQLLGQTPDAILGLFLSSHLPPAILLAQFSKYVQDPRAFALTNFSQPRCLHGSHSLFIQSLIPGGLSKITLVTILTLLYLSPRHLSLSNILFVLISLSPLTRI